MFHVVPNCLKRPYRKSLKVKWEEFSSAEWKCYFQKDTAGYCYFKMYLLHPLYTLSLRIKYFNLAQVRFFFHVQPLTFQTLFTQHFHLKDLFITNCTQTWDINTFKCHSYLALVWWNNFTQKWNQLCHNLKLLHHDFSLTGLCKIIHIQTCWNEVERGE